VKRKRSLNEKDEDKLKEIVKFTKSVDKSGGHPFANRINFPDILMAID